MYIVYTCIFNVYARYNMLSEQVFVAVTEMQISPGPPTVMHWTMGIRAVPVQKMVIFLMLDQMLKKQRRPSISL
jgi:hypothetical protein